MRQSLFIAEMKGILHNRKLLVPILAVITIPLLYAGMFLWAFWDPYENLKELPVGVINHDQGADLEGEKLTLGKELEKEIKKSDEFDFRIIDEKEAKRGLEHQKYYMLIEIPADFSSNAATLLEEQPKKLELKYVPNEGFNFLSSQMGDTAMKEIRAALQKKITKTYSETMFAKIKKMGKGFKEASSGAGKLDEGTGKLTEGAAKIKKHLAVLAGSSIQFTQGLTKAGKGSSELAFGAAKLHSGLGQLHSGQNQLVAGGKELQSGTGELAAGISKMQNGLHAVDGHMQKLTSGMAQAQAGVQQFQEKLPALKKGASGLAAGAEQLNNGLSQLEQQLVAKINQSMTQQLEEATPLLQQTLTPDQIALVKQHVANQQKELVQGITGEIGKLKAGSQQLALGSKELSGAINGQLAPNMQKLNSGLNDLQKGQKTLQAGVHKLALSGDQLAGGTQALRSGESELVSGMERVAGKIGEAKDGTAKLAEGAESLQGGLNQLKDGSKKLSEGTGQLAAGSSELANGTTELEKGVKELHDKLGDAAAKANSVQAKDENYDMMADPVTVDKEAVNHVPNYGTGFAPYFLSLGLFVGALLLTIVFPLREPAARPKNGYSWFIGKFGILLIAGTAQSILAAAVLLLGLKIEVQSVPLFLGTTMITSFTFIALVQMLVTIMGDPGRFVAVLILIFQLTTSAGTFPLELIPNALQPVSALLPMTYSVSAFKAVISSGDFAFMRENHAILGLFAAVCIGVTIVFFQGLFKRRFGNEHVMAGKEG
ncbi:YhgE/Pip domain-containing protein [Bacillus xiapuensis]|uniref:YhgE/Pip domain-containing protein n=1 Tax=Bacillus xiapuensis TaxID=2014075 RepID=UPI000C249638|nr:YhgE/Pip domain-containing protein [Bacillus xiapuensis]